jgi:hypothetical protein
MPHNRHSPSRRQVGRVVGFSDEHDRLRMATVGPGARCGYGDSEDFSVALPGSSWPGAPPACPVLPSITCC